VKICLFLLAFLSLFANEYAFPDPYPEVYDNVEILPEYRHGWYLHGQFAAFFKTRSIKTVVEVGVWTGNTTIFLAEMLPEDGKIFAVDHWLGSREHQDPGNSESALLPTLFQQFLSNVIHHRLTHKIIPVRMESLKAAKQLKKMGIRPDLIYIDASHDYMSVSRDIKAWFPLLNEGGVLCGDDWGLGGPIKGVSRAVTDFASKNNLQVCVDGWFWWYQ
jgi:SAM-dependent methyltransferase